MTLRPTCLAIAPALLALALGGGPAAAQDPLDLLRVDPGNRSGETEMSRAIVRMVAERSDSAAVRARAANPVPSGRLAVGPDEVLTEIGAVAALGMPRAVPSVIRPAPPPPPAPPAAAAPARPAPAQTPLPTAQPAAAEQKPRRYLGIFVKPEPTERGSDVGGGGGGGGGGW